MSLEIKKTKQEAREMMLEALSAESKEKFTEGLEAYGDALITDLKAEMENAQLSRDQDALSARGKKPLTSAELKFAGDFKTMAQARLKGEDVSAAFTNIKMPDETIDLIFEDIATAHPLLEHVDFQNTAFTTKWLMSKNPFQKALWGNFDAEVTKEISASFSEKDMTKLSLTAFVPVSRGLLDLGPDWIYRYVVAILQEAIANGLEDGIINNLKTDTGPIGMLADLSKGQTSGDVTTYAAKKKEPVKSLDPKTYGALLAKLAKTENGNHRPVSKVLMLVNPTDYLTKIFPAVTVLGTNGNYVQNALPFPTEFVQSAAVPEGTAILYLDKFYWLGLGQANGAGQIEQSDEYKFLERKRYYMIYLYADGTPKDNNACLPLDITGLEPASIAVKASGQTAANKG